MADPTRRSDAGDDAAIEPNRRPTGAPPKMPRWAKVSAIIVAALILLALIVMVSGIAGGGHGPGRHTGAATTSFGVPGLDAPMSSHR